MSWQSTQPIALDPAAIERAAAVKAYAIAHPESAKTISGRLAANAHGPGNRPEHHITLKGLDIVYSVEQHAPIGWCQHITFIPANRMTPPPREIARVLKAFFGIRWNPDTKHKDAENPDKPHDLWQQEHAEHIVHLLFPHNPPAKAAS